MAFFIVLIAMEAAIVHAQGNGNGNGDNGGGNENGQGNDQGNGKDQGKHKGKEKDKSKEKEKEKQKGKKEKEKKPKKHHDEASDYDKLTPLPTGQERAFCKANTSCQFKTLVCPSECMNRKPKKNKKQKACFLDCSSKCEATCKCKFTSIAHILLYSTFMQ